MLFVRMLLLLSLGSASAFSGAPSLASSRPTLLRGDAACASGLGVPGLHRRGTLAVGSGGEHETDDGHEQLMKRVLDILQVQQSFDKPVKPPASTIAPQFAVLNIVAATWAVIVSKFFCFLAGAKSFIASAKARIKGRSAKASISSSTSTSKMSTARSAVVGTASGATSAMLATAINAQSAVVKTSKQITSAFAVAKQKLSTRKLSVAKDTPESGADVATTPSEGKPSSWPSVDSITIPPGAQEAAKKAAGFAVPVLALGAAVVSMDLIDLALAGVASMAITSAVADLAIEERKRERAKKTGSDSEGGAKSPEEPLEA